MVGVDEGVLRSAVFFLRVLRGACRAVVQEYISKPALLEGLKFDLRMYVTVIGGSDTTPPRVWLCREAVELQTPSTQASSP